MTASCLDESRALAFVAGQLEPTLRETVEAHIDDCDSCRQVLAALVKSSANPATGPTIAMGSGVDVGNAATVGARPANAGDSTTWDAGTKIGRYVIRGRLGKGGMGEVYRAEDPELSRQVALKRVLARQDDTEMRARLIREARAAAQLAHPNVVGVYEVGDASGTPFIAMELVDGVTLTQWLKESRGWREIVGIFTQAGRGLAAAHERGLVHRDFKPDNVLVDRSGRARVADFGLARAWDGERIPAAEISGAASSGSDGLARLTATGVVSGTPAYMAPELVDGGAPNAASDQYAFAVALFEALRGQHPFAGKTPAALWANMAEGNIRDGGRTIPAWLDRAVRRGMAVEPALRWPSIGSFVEAIARPPRRVWPWLVGAGVIAVASLVVAIAALVRQPEPVEKVAEGDWPMPVKKLIQNGVLAGIDGDHYKAIAVCEVALVASPENAWALQTIAFENCKLGNFARGQSVAAHLPPAMQPSIREACTPPPPDEPPAPQHVAEPAPAATATKAASGKPAKAAKLSADDIKAMLKESGMDNMRGNFQDGLELAQEVLASDPTNGWAHQLVVLHSCALYRENKYDKADAKEIERYKQLALANNPGIDAKRRGLIHTQCDRDGIWLEGDIEEVGTHQKWHAGPTPMPRPDDPNEPQAKEKSAHRMLVEADAMKADDPAGALVKIEAVMAADPTNKAAQQMAVTTTCEIAYKAKLRGAQADFDAAEKKARAYWDKLDLHSRWLVWSECDRWAGIRMVGDVDRLGDGKITHIDPK